MVTHKSLDLRVRRTHKLLWEALLTLLADRNFDTIGVKEICDLAMVHRTTFYKHYEDKFDLLKRGMQRMQELLVAEIEQTGKDFSSYQRLFTHIATHERFYRVMLCGTGVGSFQAQMRSAFAEAIARELRRQGGVGHSVTIPASLRAHFYAGALVSTLTWWLSQAQRPSSEQMGYYLQQLIEAPTPHGGTR
jgi:AcrR family transcriptional regulator